MRYHLTNVRACLYSTESHFRDSAMASTSAGSFMLYAVSCIHVVLLAPLQFRSLAHACIHTLVPSERVSYHYNVLLSCRSGKFEYVTVSIRDRQYSPVSCVAHLSNYKQRSVLEHSRKYDPTTPPAAPYSLQYLVLLLARALQLLACPGLAG